MKNKFVKFEDGKARIFVSSNPLFLTGPGVYLNPDLSAVKGHGPEFWKEQNGAIVLVDDVYAISNNIKRSKYDYIIYQKTQAIRDEFLKVIEKNKKQDELTRLETTNKLVKLEQIHATLDKKTADLENKINMLVAAICIIGLIWNIML